MSFNTTAIISAPYVGRSFEPFVDEARFGHDKKQRFGKIPCAEHAGGANAFSDHSGGVWAAEFDYVSASDLLQWFINLPWGTSDVATLTAESEAGDAVMALSIGGKVGVVLNRAISYHGPEQPVVDVRKDWRAVE